MFFWEEVSMSQLSYLNIDHRYLYLGNAVPDYYGLQMGCLDMHTMKYRVFGAVWKLIDGRKYILGYWFADQESDILIAIKDAGFTDPIKSDLNEINEVYQSIRIEQDKENWSKRSRLRFLSIVKKPWKDLRKGWYVLKSSDNFPCTLTCIQKKRYSIWIEHIKVCETEGDIKKFLDLLNLEHDIKLFSEMLRIN
jgi:hypothetical protein